jgi:hypothetical protein
MAPASQTWIYRVVCMRRLIGPFVLRVAAPEGSHQRLVAARLRAVSVRHSSVGCDSRRLRSPRRARFDPFSPSVESWRVGARSGLPQVPPCPSDPVQAKCTAKWSDGPTKHSSPKGAWRPPGDPSALPRIALASRRSPQSSLSLATGRATSSLWEPVRFGAESERVSVRLLHSLASRELQRP